jgi:hypothetical protein
MVNRDFSDLFAAFNEAGASYLVVGAHAVAFHAEPRYTKDLDLWVDASEQNATLVMNALRAFGAPLHDISDADFARPGITLQIGIAPNRIDIATQIDGIHFADAWPNGVASTYGEHPIWVIGRADLIANKRAAGRAQDRLDVELLERHGS